MKQDTYREALAGLFEEDEMAKWKKNVKGLMNQRVRMGFLTLPLWVVGAVYVAKMVRDRRHQQRLAA